MGFWRGLGYFINIIWIIGCFVLPYAIFSIWLPILFLYVLRKGAKNEAMRKDIHDMATAQRENEKRLKIVEEKKRLEDLEKWK